MAQPENQSTSDLAKRIGGSLRSLVRRAADRPLHQVGTVATASRARVQKFLGVSRPEPPPQRPTPSQPIIPLITLRRSLGRAGVACENQAVCGGTIELALHEHAGSKPDVGETTVLEATMIYQTCECELSEEQRENVTDRVLQTIRSRK
jgi:hypothetical protein